MSSSKECVNHIIVNLTEQGFVKPQAAQLSLNVAGRLSQFIKNRQALTTDKWVIETIQGFRIPFLNPPVQVHQPNLLHPQKSKVS